jgi:hypothetical protein
MTRFTSKIERNDEKINIRDEKLVFYDEKYVESDENYVVGAEARRGEWVRGKNIRKKWNVKELGLH